MADRPRSARTSDGRPDRLLVLSGGAQHIWIKLQWEANRLKAAREATPFDLISTLYGAIDFAITAQSLEDWTIRALTQRDRRNGLNAGAYRKAIAAAVPMQPAFRDIANTAKHGEYRDDNWLGGTVELVHTPGFTGTAREYVLIYHGEGATAQTSLEVFDQATLQWRLYLTRMRVPGFEGLPAR
ncbi:hypothetical protein [Brevundimonas aurantiaca]|uniref:hypothetical protein n=1 Tax=Brevundimonas aurantiaca TaxID=74316 RepID=UPI0016008163|nr:hypothetical protein [Pseudomonas sp. FW305-3-2-15-E-TSA4]